MSHNLLLQKIYDYGIRGQLWKWLRSYLLNRKLIVSFGGEKSSSFTPTLGIPQGSVLGPFLFNLFIIDLAGELKCEFLQFVDDLKLYTTIKNSNVCTKLQNDITIFSTWCISNNLKRNINKCKFLRSYFIGHTELEKVHSIRDLGVIFDSKLKFDKHILAITNKAYKMLGFILRINREFKQRECIQLLYKTLLRPHIEYCSTIWNPNYQIYKSHIERVQRMYTRHKTYVIQA